MKKLLLLVAGAAGLALGSTACNPVTPYAAVVNGTTIPASDLHAELDALAQAGAGVGGQTSGTYSAQAAAQVLSQRILFVVIEQEMARRHVHVTAADMSAARVDIANGGQFPQGAFAKFPESYKDVVTRRQADLTALAAALAGVDISPAGVSAYAAQHPEALQNVCAEQIVVNDLVSAATVENDLKAGKSFASEAQARSQDSNTASAGGQLGCHPGLAYSQLGQGVEQAVTSIPLGQPSAPVKGDQGLVILEVTSRTPLSEQEASTAIRQTLTTTAQNEEGQLIEPLLARADVLLDARYGKWVRASANGPEVVPPTAPKVRSDSASG